MHCSFSLLHSLASTPINPLKLFKVTNNLQAMEFQEGSSLISQSNIKFPLRNALHSPFSLRNILFTPTFEHHKSWVFFLLLWKMFAVPLILPFFVSLETLSYEISQVCSLFHLFSYPSDLTLFHRLNLQCKCWEITISCLRTFQFQSHIFNCTIYSVWPKHQERK